MEHFESIQFRFGNGKLLPILLYKQADPYTFIRINQTFEILWICMWKASLVSIKLT